MLLNTYYQPTPALIAPDAIALFSTPGIKRTVAKLATSWSDAQWQSGVEEQLRKFMSNSKVKEEYIKVITHQSLGIRPAFYGLNDVLTQEVQSRKDTAVKALGAFQKPVLIIYGDDDHALNSGVARAFYRLFPNATLHIIKGAGHYVQVDAPQKVADYILKGISQ